MHTTFHSFYTNLHLTEITITTVQIAFTLLRNFPFGYKMLSVSLYYPNHLDIYIYFRDFVSILIVQDTFIYSYSLNHLTDIYQVPTM